MRRYEKYKDSDVEWLGNVPEHWQVLELGRIADLKCDGPFGSGLKSDHYTDSGALVVRLQNIRVEGFFSGEPAFIDLDYFEQELQRHEVLPGDLLIAGLGDDNNIVGRACVAPGDLGPALVKADCFRFRLSPTRAAADYIAAQLSAGARFDAGQLAGGSTRSRIPLSSMATRRICLPPLVEQLDIAVFLLEESNKIDALIEEQQRLIELLKEKCQAVISQAVTKGLDPSLPMKDSEVEWLGSVPEHWNVIALKRLIDPNTSISYGIVQPGDALDEGVPFVQTTNMTNGVFSVEGLQKTTSEIASMYPRSQLTGGEVLLGIRASIGAAHIVPDTLIGANLSRGVARIVPNEMLTSSFLVAYFGSGVVRHYWELSKQGSTFNEVSIETVRELLVCVPPLREQMDVVSHLSNTRAELDSLIQESEFGVGLLQERRSALISAAVTGKIDVRCFQPEVV
jgi:type I restriction enzyme S subunit